MCHVGCPVSQGTFADNSTRKCVIYCPLGSFADPVTQICVQRNDLSMQSAPQCLVSSEAMSLEIAYSCVTGESTPIPSVANVPTSAPPPHTETLPQGHASLLAHPPKTPSQTHSLTYASISANPITMQIPIHDIASKG